MPSKKKKPSRGRAPRPVRRTGTEVMADKRTHRKRSRSDAERADLESQEELDAWDLSDEGFDLPLGYPV